MASPVLVATVCVFVLHRVRRRRRQKDVPKIPLAPGTVPIIGNIGLIKAYSQDTPHKKYEEFAEAAGEAGVLRICVLGHTRLILTTPASFAAVLRRGVFLPKPPAFYNVFMMLGIKGTPILNETREAEHTRVRTHLMHSLNADTVAASIWQLSDTVQRSIAAIAECDAAGPQQDSSLQQSATIDSSDAACGVVWGDVNDQGVVVNAYPLTAANILSVVFRVFLEVDMTPPMAEFADCLAHASSVSAHPIMLRLLRLGLSPGRRRFRHNFATLYAFHHELLRRVYARPMPEGSTAMWAALRRAFPAAMSDEAEAEAAIANLAFIYGAGYETTGNAAMHTLAALAIDQDSQTALAEELNGAGLLATSENPKPRAVTAEDLSNLTVLDAITHESLRLMSTAPNGGLRVLLSDTEISGYLVPKGTEVLMPSWSLHYNKHVWGDDAAYWRPDRWLEGTSVAAGRKDGDGNLRYQPFLTGPSNCVGQHLAVAELKMLVTSLVSALHITVDAQRMSHLRSVEDYVAEARTRITLQREAPCWLRMKPRAPA
eukprot:jgi/Ulvmu1/7755/UM039_0063.1